MTMISNNDRQTGLRLLKYYLVIVSLFFQPVFERVSSVFSYYDEFLCLLFFFSFLLKVIKTGKICKDEARYISLLVILIVIGLMGNLRVKHRQPTIAILTDIFSNIKLYLFLLPLIRLRVSTEIRRKLSRWLSNTIRMLILFMFLCAVVTQLFNIGMSGETRFGLTSFQFVFENPAGLNTYMYALMVVFSATLCRNGKPRPYSTAFLGMALVTWVLTLRSRAIAFAFIYTLLYYIIIFRRFSRKTFRFKWYYVIPLTIVAVLLGWSSIEQYFLVNSRQARYVLMHGAIEIARDYFPIGTGFGSFGTAASRNYYSAVYQMYNMHNVWGLAKTSPYFILDQYWFGIIGQFGVLGLLIMLLLVFCFYKQILGRAKGSSTALLAALTLLYTSLFASVAAASYIQPSILISVFVVILLSGAKANEWW